MQRPKLCCIKGKMGGGEEFLPNWREKGTKEGLTEEVKAKIKEETARIFSDYEFVKGNPDAASFRNRIAQYKKIMLV